MARRPGLGAAAGGLLLLVSLWLPWFERSLASVFAPIQADKSLSGWSVLGGLAGAVAVVAAGAAAWGLMRGRRPSALWLVIAGGLALMAQVAATVARVGAEDNGQVVTTTRPGFGLVVAIAGAVAIVLSGLTAMVREAAQRIRAS
jgi:hypothetical protein